jgi:HAD superfamily hydrolase (TIGR01509 family)
MIKTVIFDLGNVLLYFNHDQMFLQLAKQLQLPFQHIKKRVLEEDWVTAYETGLLTTDEMLEKLQADSPHLPRRASLLEAMNSIFRENASLTPIVHQLKKQGKRLLIVSNTNEAHFQFIQRNFSFISAFDEVILSYEVKHAKPHRKIFEKAIEKALGGPHECFYVDDISTHVEAARNLGIDAEVYTSTEKLREDLALRLVFV